MDKKLAQKIRRMYILRMRIVHISLYPARNEHHSSISGVASYTKNLAESLPKNNGDEVFVLAQRLDGAPERYDENGIHVVRCFDRKLGYVKQIFRELASLKPDVVHIQQELALYGGIPTAIRLRSLIKKSDRLAPAVITLHGVVSLRAITPSFVRENNARLPVFLVRMAFAYIFRPLCRYAAHIVVHEKPFKTILREEYRIPEAKISVIHHGIEDIFPENRLDARCFLALPQDARIVLYMGYLTGYKGLDLLIDGFKEYLQRDAHALLVIGAGPHPKLKNDPAYQREYVRIENRACEALGEHLRWLGFIEEKSIPFWYSAADLTVFPYTVSMSSSGPMALSLAYRRAFIASNVFAPVFEGDTLLFARDAAALANRIEDFFARPEVYLTIAEDLRKKRLWKNVGEASHALYTLLKTNKG